MNGVEIKTTTTTQMKIKKATIDEQGAVYVDGEVVDLINALKNTFEGCIFDLAVTEKNRGPCRGLMLSALWYILH